MWFKRWGSNKNQRQNHNSLELYIPGFSGGSNVTGSHKEGAKKVPVTSIGHVKLTVWHKWKELSPNPAMDSGVRQGKG